MIWYILFTATLGAVLGIMCDNIEIDGFYKFAIGLFYGFFMTFGYFIQYIQ